MSNTSKIVLWVVVAVVVIGGIWVLVGGSGSNTTTQNQTSGTEVNTVATVPVLPPAPVDTSDTSVNTDVSQIDTQLKGLGADIIGTVPASDNQ